MKLIIAGSRSINNIELLYWAIEEFDLTPTTIISGGAYGVDRLGEDFAREFGLNLEIFPANWNKFGKSAGFRRNEEMAHAGDALLALWDGHSNGTRHMIDEMRKVGKTVYLYTVSTNSTMIYGA